MIRAFLFDLGGVVVRNGWAGPIAEWEPRLGLKPGGLIDAIFRGNDDQAGIGRVTEEQWWDVVRRRLGLDAVGLQRLREDFYADESADPLVVELIGALRPRFRVAYVTNAWSDVRVRLARLGIDTLADEIVVSSEVGSLKPGSRIYRVALERLGVQASEAVFVDDVAVNVDAARELGMRTVHFLDAATALEELRALEMGAQ